MEVKKEIIVNKSITEVWEVLGNQYGEAYKWARGLYHSEAHGLPKISGAICSNRTCDTSFGKLQEEVRVFKANEQLSYEVVKGFPSFIETGVNNWYLNEIGANRTKVTMHFVGKTEGFMGVIMGPMMKMNLKKGLGQALSDFKFYVENDKPSPEKLKDNKKNSKKLKAVA
ncbi:hypothetical protein MED152_06915 [Polaribacter sp. MED152]|nr:hypothetical protein MED152_06915 [Polaribacter sp. MED152]